jgi:PKD repeat protein
MRPGTYTVSLTVSNGVETDTETNIGYVTVAPYVVDFEAYPRRGVPPLPVQFTDLTTGIAPDQWIWDFGDRAGSTERNPMHIYRISQAYNVKMTVKITL